MRLKPAVDEVPVAETVTVYAPVVAFAVKTAEVATPLASVVAVFTPLAGDPFDMTVATSGAANAVPTVAVCGVPLVAAIDSTTGTEVTVSVAEPVMPSKAA